MCVLIFIAGACVGAVAGVGGLVALVRGDLDKMEK